MNNKYDLNIENSRINRKTNMNINPYINQVMNQKQVNNGQQNQAGFNNGDFLKGALIGTALTFLLTNKGTQESLMKAASKGSELFQAGMEELKERYEDVKAATEANQE